MLRLPTLSLVQLHKQLLRLGFLRPPWLLLQQLLLPYRLSLSLSVVLLLRLMEYHAMQVRILLKHSDFQVLAINSAEADAQRYQQVL
jgi:hypothetical protein